MKPEVIAVVDPSETPELMGAGLLALVTTGLYDDPLSMYREYIQNAADAVSGSGTVAEARVEISIDVTHRRIGIRDNGPGLSRKDALGRLLPIGRSSKRLGIDRGIRGIGRLAGLAFAKTVAFTTRTCKDQPATRITWHSDRLPDLTSSESELEQAILECVDVETLSGREYPDHFLEVEIGDVARHSAGLLLNRDAVRDYIGEVCPVPMSTKFHFASKVEGLFDGAKAPLTIEVLLEGDPYQSKDPTERLFASLPTRWLHLRTFRRSAYRALTGMVMRPLGGSHTPPTWARFPKSSEFAVSEPGRGIYRLVARRCLTASIQRNGSTDGVWGSFTSWTHGLSQTLGVTIFSPESICAT